MKERRFAHTKYLLCILILSSCLCDSMARNQSTEESMKVDILVYESTPSGIIASIAASKDGWDVVILSPYKHVGGMRTSGLSMPNILNRETFGGLGREFHNRILKYYVQAYGPNSPQVRDCDGGFKFEPGVAERIFRDWLAESGVTVLTEEYVIGVKKDGSRLLSVQTNRNRTISANVFVDASYEGDLLAMSGVAFHVGRESREAYGEALAGMTYPPGKVGQGDDQIQRFVYRLVLTDSIENQVPITRPKTYHPAMYMVEAAMLRSNPPTSLTDLLSLNKVPNRKTDVRVWEGWLGGSHRWPESSINARKVLAREHREYAEGYLWFLLHDESVPDAVKTELQRWGYSKDEFADNENWPYQLYVREARRMVGEYVMTERDITDERFKPDGIAIGDFHIDVHPVQYVAIPREEASEGHSHRGGVVGEGSVWKAVTPYEIPYRALLPRKNEADNLIVSVTVSSSHIGYAAIRMEPIYMMMGHAAGVAASMSLSKKRKLHDLSVDQLRKRLKAEGAVLDARGFERETERK